MMTPTRPYFLRAIYEWIVDNNCTPYLAVDADYPHVEVPREYVEDGRITLNVSPSAVVGLVMDNDELTFSARFSGVSRQIAVPMGAVMGIYAKENGQGMAFPDEAEYIREYAENLDEEDFGDDEPEPPRPGGGRPQLKVVK